MPRPHPPVRVDPAKAFRINHRWVPEGQKHHDRIRAVQPPETELQGAQFLSTRLLWEHGRLRRSQSAQVHLGSGNQRIGRGQLQFGSACPLL